MKKIAFIALCVGLILVMGLGVFLLISSLRQPAQRTALPPMSVANTPRDPAVDGHMVPLYFLSSDHRYLARERRAVVLDGRLEERLSAIVEELLAGPKLRNLLPTMPPGTRLQSLFWDEKEHRVVISLSRDFLDRRPGHTLAEWASIYSLVNTVADQGSSIRSVQILVDGKLVEEGTVWDFSEPFAPDHTFVLYGSAEAGNSPG